jgi:hypothetical protein
MPSITCGYQPESEGFPEHHKERKTSMPRISGLERNQAPWHLRWFYRVMRKMFGKDLTPAKMQMRVPGIVWGSIAMEAGLGKRRRMSLRYIQLAKVRTAARIGCPF